MRTKGFSLIELMIVVAIIGILSTVVAIGFKRYMIRSRMSEGALAIRFLSDATLAYYATEHFDSSGTLLPRGFPANTPTPSPNRYGCCGLVGNRCPVDSTLWTLPTWQALHFSVDQPTYFTYSYYNWAESFGMGPSGALPGSFVQPMAIFSFQCVNWGAMMTTIRVNPDQSLSRSAMIISGEYY